LSRPPYFNGEEDESLRELRERKVRIPEVGQDFPRTGLFPSHPHLGFWDVPWHQMHGGNSQSHKANGTELPL
jgi:hypothetical protein